MYMNKTQRTKQVLCGLRIISVPLTSFVNTFAGKVVSTTNTLSKNTFTPAIIDQSHKVHSENIFLQNICTMELQYTFALLLCMIRRFSE
jgi:hypothetical protein